MAVAPSRNVTEILSSTVAGRPSNGTQAARSGGQQTVTAPQGRVTPEPDGGYDPTAPRGTYVDITA